MELGSLLMQQRAKRNCRQKYYLNPERYLWWKMFIRFTVTTTGRIEVWNRRFFRETKMALLWPHSQECFLKPLCLTVQLEADVKNNTGCFCPLSVCLSLYLSLCLYCLLACLSLSFSLCVSTILDINDTVFIESEGVTPFETHKIIYKVIKS